MKIHLEQKLSSCPEQMTCIVCHDLFWTPNIRALLFNDHNLIQGDVCRSCLKLKSTHFKQKLRNQANRLIQESILIPQRFDALQDRAIELLETSEELIFYPTVFHWLFKRLEIFAKDSQALEAARFRNASCQCEGWKPSLGQNLPHSHLSPVDED
jgi:hypothetical protein